MSSEEQKFFVARAKIKKKKKRLKRKIKHAECRVTLSFSLLYPTEWNILVRVLSLVVALVKHPVENWQSTKIELSIRIVLFEN